MTLCGLECNCSCSCNAVIISILIYLKLLVKYVETTTLIPVPYICDMVKALYFWSWYREVFEEKKPNASPKTFRL